MSLQIPIQKDIGAYQEKIVGKMSLRTLVCVACGFGSAIVVACIVFFGFGIPVGNATFPVMAVSVPFWLAGFWRPMDLKLEEFAVLFFRHSFTDQLLIYRSTPSLSCPDEPRRQMTRKEKKAFLKKGGEIYDPEIKNDPESL
ncbi:MAG: PrgI family protein [Eggerthellaceae bacterium]|nr:PrgI family protein [Eggerthellaceae bacterium]